MRIAAVVGDLLIYSRIESAATAVGASLTRVDDPSALPPDLGLDLILVDWSARDSSWADPLRHRREAGTSVVLFGPHVDLDAHAAARDAGLGPMWARSRLLGALPDVLVLRDEV
jgi:hypothetical protein